MNDQHALAIMRELPEARLPASYEAARVALAHCSKIDECKKWADKAEALASYAKQANDRTLHVMADRIQARAIQREGELLQEIESARGKQKRMPDGTISRGATTNGRIAAAREAGLSRDQAVTALRVANVPKDEFEEAVESDNPPTVTELARRGTVSKPKPLVDLGQRTPQEFEAATGFFGAIDALRRYSAKADLQLAIKGLDKRERVETRKAATEAFQWLVVVMKMLDAPEP